MIKSMTGFGRGSAGRGQNKIEVEIRSVNSRFLEIKINGSKLEPIAEKKIRDMIESNLHRGNVFLRIHLKLDQDKNKVNFNKVRFEMINDILKKIHVDYGQKLDLSDIISTNDLLILDEPEDLKNNVLIKAVELGLNQVNKMREKEGHQIEKDIRCRIENIQNLIKNIELESKNYSNERQNKMREKISKLLDEKELDESRLIQEVAYISERVDITEEIVRSRSHFDQLLSYLSEPEPVGKRINFLLQEIGREVNTIGSKSPQLQVTNHVIEIKGELEKIREQAQNIL
tara:strand:+ start:410 stop:1270 length:861 start_codon:yes stop_codon:yes gene_type:complete